MRRGGRAPRAPPRPRAAGWPQGAPATAPRHGTPPRSGPPAPASAIAARKLAERTARPAPESESRNKKKRRETRPKKAPHGFILSTHRITLSAASVHQSTSGRVGRLALRSPRSVGSTHHTAAPVRSHTPKGRPPHTAPMIAASVTWLTAARRWACSRDEAWSGSWNGRAPRMDSPRQTRDP